VEEDENMTAPGYRPARQRMPSSRVRPYLVPRPLRPPDSGMPDTTRDT
jgi:hypothetical protein